MPLSEVAVELIGVEADHAAVEHARENAQTNDRQNLQIVQSDVDATLENASVKPDVVVVDPPRAGCGVKAAVRLTELHPQRIVYVSCKSFNQHIKSFIENVEATAEAEHVTRRRSKRDRSPRAAQPGCRLSR